MTIQNKHIKKHLLVFLIAALFISAVVTIGYFTLNKRAYSCEFLLNNNVITAGPDYTVKTYDGYIVITVCYNSKITAGHETQTDHIMSIFDGYYYGEFADRYIDGEDYDIYIYVRNNKDETKAVIKYEREKGRWSRWDT